jgi:hypothetical protein
MGLKYFDAYAPSHFFGGVTFYLLGFDFISSILLHTFFEIFENYYWVQKSGYCIKLPPILKLEDCKTKPDSVKNIIGDTISFMLGYIFSIYFIKKAYLKNINLYLKVIIITLIVPLGYSLITTNLLGYLPEYEHFKK